MISIDNLNTEDKIKDKEGCFFRVISITARKGFDEKMITIKEEGSESTYIISADELRDYEYATIVKTYGNPYLKPMVEAFLDAKSYDERIKLLDEMEKEVDRRDINIMSTGLDIIIDDALSLSEAFMELKKAILLHRKYETNRLR